MIDSESVVVCLIDSFIHSFGVVVFSVAIGTTRRLSRDAQSDETFTTYGV